jgi:signal transduction histidine kinase
MSSFSTLTAGIAHEINNPLNYIQYGKLAINDYVNAHCKEHISKLHPLIETIDSGIKNAACIIQSLGKINQNQNKPHENLDIHAIIENCIELLLTKTQEKIEVKSNLYNQPLSFLGNESEMYQIIISLIENGIDAIHKTAKKGEIIISTKLENKHIVMIICDSGCGIPKSEINKITDPFYTSKPPGQGTGLGLFTTYTLVEKHKGSMHFQSELNKGTCVTLAFPEP